MMIEKFIKIFLFLFIVSVVFNGCASLSAKNMIAKDGFKNNSTTEEQKLSESLNNYNEDGSYNSSKELAMGMVSLFALPLLLPIIFIAALFSGVG